MPDVSADFPVIAELFTFSQGIFYREFICLAVRTIRDKRMGKLVRTTILYLTPLSVSSFLSIPSEVSQADNLPLHLNYLIQHLVNLINLHNYCFQFDSIKIRRNK